MNIRIARAKRKLRSRVAGHPFLYWPVARLFSTGEVVTPFSDLVIEGFPRSGNSYAEAAFRVTQPNTLKLAHHCHAASQVILAIRWGVPCIVLIREPIEACASLFLHHPGLFSPEQLLEEYIDFYTAVKRVNTSQIVVARFDTVVSDFGAVIRATNAKYGTAFDTSESKEVADQDVFEVLNRLGIQRSTTPLGGELYSLDSNDPRVISRNNSKRLASLKFCDSSLEQYLCRAKELFEDFSEIADV